MLTYIHMVQAMIYWFQSERELREELIIFKERVGPKGEKLSLWQGV